MLITCRGTLETKTSLTPDVFLLRFRLSQPLEFVAGQYVVLLVPHGADFARRLFSIASSPASSQIIELVVKIISGGIASEYLKTMKAGETIDIQGPAGVFTLDQESDKTESIFLATGTGIAPFMSILRSMVDDRWSMIGLYWGLRKLSDTYFFDELKALHLAYPSFSFTICLSQEQSLNMLPEGDRQFFRLGRITSFIESSLSKIYYVCGNRNVVEEVRQLLYGKGVEKEKIRFEKF